MRDVPSYISERLKKNIQTRANNSDPAARIWVCRPSTVLANDEFLERQTVLNSSVSDVSIAVCHPRIRRSNTDIYMAYISGGKARIVTSKHQTKMERHLWSDTGFNEDATAISIAFDGTMPKAYGSEIEFVTEQTPWVFWVNDGKLFARKLGGETITLAEANCQDVSAIRAAWSQASAFEFGLVAFFILGGSLYYRQLINGEWTDGELVSFGPSGVTWAAVSAFRTWDFRVGVQLKSTNGDIYELFTRFMGIGTRNSEHIEISNTAKTSSVITKIERFERSVTEHVDISNSDTSTVYQGLFTLGTPTLLSVCNVDDGTGDWGKQVVLTFDKELNNETVQASIGSFYFVDSNGVWYYPSSITMDRTGRRATLTFVDINNASGECTAYYEPGTVVTMTEEVLSAQEYKFTPINLVPNPDALPKVVEILAENEIGTEVSVRFSEPIVGIKDGCADKFIVTINYPEYSPGGKTSSHICPVIAVEHSDDANTIILRFADGMESSIRNAVGEVSIQYTGTMLVGEKGPVLGFLHTFTPVGLYMKPNPHDPEHIEIRSASIASKLTHVEYLSASAPGEHVTIIGASKTGVLTHIDYV